MFKRGVAEERQGYGSGELQDQDRWGQYLSAH